MQNQNDYDKVNKHMIAPLCQLFQHAKLSDELVEGFVEELSEFSDETLKKAFKKLRRERKQMPSIAHAVDVCRSLVENKGTRLYADPESKLHCMKAAEKFHPQQARAILESPAGQLALSLGVGRDLLCEYEVSGRTDFDEAFVRKCSRIHKQNCENMAKSDPNNPFHAAMLGLYEAMMARERRLSDEFGGKNQLAIA